MSIEERDSRCEQSRKALLFPSSGSDFLFCELVIVTNYFFFFYLSAPKVDSGEKVL